MSRRYRRPHDSSGSGRRPTGLAVLILVPVLLLAIAGLASAGSRPAARRGSARDAAPGPSEAAVTCSIVVPPRPLSAAGLATAYRLSGPRPGTTCPERAFVQGTVIGANGALSVYNPLVIDDGTEPAAAPVVPKLPRGAVVGLWFGFNGDNLVLRGTGRSLAEGRCVNGLRDSIFGQFAHCNAPAFFTAANRATRAGKVTIPPLGIARDGEPCPTTRDFSVVDQDQSDNVTTTYLVDADGRRAQNTAANRKTLGAGARIEVNGSDNLLVDAFVDVALGCSPFTAPDLADGGAAATALALNELHAAQQAEPVALVPVNNPMTLVGGKQSVRKTNLYRAAVNQRRFNARRDSAEQYCRDLFSEQPARLEQDRALLTDAASPDPGEARDLFSFMALRLSGSFDDLGCGGLLGIDNPVTIVRDGDLAVDASFAAATPKPTAPSRPAAPNRLSRQLHSRKQAHPPAVHTW